MGIHAWRQTQTMSVVENFVQEDMNILNPRINPRGSGDGIFRMEFPLMQWVFALGYKLLGNKLMLARILSFLISIFSIFGFYKYLQTWNLDKTTSALGAWCFSWSPVVFYYEVNPLPDNLALGFAIWSLVFLKRLNKSSSTKSLIGFAVFLSLATAVKLPFILFGAGYIPLFIRGLKKLELRKTLVSTGPLLLIMAPSITWYAWVIPQWTNTQLIGGIGAEESFDYSSAISTIWRTLHSMLPELLINYGSLLFFLVGIGLFFKSSESWKRLQIELSILSLLILFYLFEVNMIGLEHDYYLFPFLPFIFLIVTAGISPIINHKKKLISIIGFIALAILPMTAYLRTANRWTAGESEMTLHKHKAELRGLLPNGELIIVGNDRSHQIILYHLGKKGWAFEQNWLAAEDLETHINQGAKFLYINTNLVEETPRLKQFTLEPIFEQDGITVYPLALPTDS